MKTWAKILIWIAGVGAVVGAGAYFFYSKQINLLRNKLKYKLVKFTPEKISDKETKIKFVMQITSESTIEAKVKKLYIEIVVDGHKLGIIENTEFKGPDGIVRDYFIIPARGFSNVPLELTISPKLVLGSAVEGILNYISNKDMNISLTGYVNVQSAFVSVTVPFSYDTTLKEIMAPSSTV